MRHFIESNGKTFIEKMYCAIYDSTHSIRLFVTPDYKIKLFNKKANDISISYYNRELKVDDCFLAYSQSTINKIDSDFKNNLNKALQGDYVESEKEVKNLNISLWFRTEYYPVYIDNELIGISISARDISKRINNEILLKKQNQALQDIIFFESHEVRRPVGSILGLIQLLDKDQITGQNKETIEMLEKTTKMLDEITKTIIDKCIETKYYLKPQINTVVHNGQNSFYEQTWTKEPLPTTRG